MTYMSRCVNHSCRSRSEFARTVNDFFGLRMTQPYGFSIEIILKKETNNSFFFSAEFYQWDQMIQQFVLHSME